MKNFKQGKQGVAVRRRNLLNQTISEVISHKDAYKLCRYMNLKVTSVQRHRMIAHNLNSSYVIEPIEKL